MNATDLAVASSDVSTVELQLGTAVNLLYGVRPTWTGTDESLFAPPAQATVPIPTTIEPQVASWGFPIVTVHRDAQNLLSTLYDYQVASAYQDPGAFSVPAGPLALGDADAASAIAAAGRYLGLDLGKGESYMLVRLRRFVGSVQHPALSRFGDRNRDEYLTPAAQQAYRMLATATGISPADLVSDADLTTEQAAAYVQALYQYGTHFVSSVSAGDVIFQVFAYPADRFRDLSASFARDKDASGQVTGINAVNYEYYTSPIGTGPDTAYGYASQIGGIVAFSGDPQLATTLASHAWDDQRYVGGPGIFQAFSPAHTVGRFLDQFQAVVPISVGLSPVSDLVPLAFQAAVLTRLMKGALLQKYGQAVTVPFASPRTIGWSTLYPQSGPEWLSTIATPTIDIYQEIVDLASVQLINTDVVKTFTVASMALLVGGSAPVKIPGNSLTVASYILDTSANKTVPTLTLSATAFDALNISVGEMYGALTLATSNGTRRDVLLDGFRFTAGPVDGATQRSTVRLAGRVTAPPDAGTLASLTRDLQFSLMSAEARLWGSSASQDEVRKLTIGYLEWLSSLVPADCQDIDLVAIGAQAQYLAKAALSLGGYGVPVPYLTFESYQGYVDSMVQVADDLSDSIRTYQQKIDAARQAELTAKTAQEINDNIKATGGVLTEYFGVLAQNQSDVASYYGAIVNQKRQEFAKSVTDIDRLQSSLGQQQKAVNQAVADFKQAVADWETEQVLKLCFQVATDVFSLGVAFAIPATEINAVKSLGETAQKIQKVMSVLAALAKLENGLETGIRSLAGAQRALQQLDQPLAMPSSLEWQEFSINLSASLATVPGDLAGPKASLMAAFQILSLRGQALVTARAKQAQILTDIYFNERQKDINTKQAARLAALQTALHLGNTSAPDLPGIDLVGLTSEVQGRLQQVLCALSKTLLLQDGAVQFTYLGAPATPQRFDITSLKQVMMQQQANIVTGLSQLNPPPLPVDRPIEYRIAAVPVQALTDGNVFTFTLQPSATPFWKYAMVRVDKVLLSIDGIKSSDGGEYLAALTFVGDPFEDRDGSRRSIEFNTVDRNFGPYDYNIATGVPEFGDQTGAIDSSITKITPFGTWRVSLPNTATNKGLTFSGPTVDVVLTFKITALLVDTPARLALARMPRQGGLSAAVTGAPGTSLSDLLNNMYTAQAVLKGWDAVFNVMEDPVNAFLAQQYEALFKGQTMPIDFGFCTGPIPFQGQYIGTYNKFHIDLGGPLLQFEQNNHSFVTVKQAIKSGYTQVGSKSVAADWDPSKASMNDPGVDWGAQTQIDVSNSPYVQGSVALSQVQGLVQPAKQGSTTQSVVLHFAQGSFVAKDLKVTTDNANLNNQLTNWFVTNPITYIVNTVDFSNITLLPALTPTKFLLNVLTTNSKKNILQQFITTNGTQQSNLTINANEPIPDSYDCSLMVNTKVMFQDIFVQSFNQGSTNVLVSALDPGNDFSAWSAQIRSGTVTGTVNFSNSGNTQYRMSSSGNSIEWDISGLQFMPTPMLAVKLNYQTTKSQYFEARQWYSSEYGGSWGSWNGHSVNVNVVLTGDYPLTVKNSGEYAGKNQTIQLQSTPPNVDVSNTSLQPTGPCECNDHDLQITVLNELAKDIPGALQAQMASIKFTAISLFALESLLFPGGSLITMDAAYVPGDLLVVGHFTNQPSA